MMEHFPEIGDVLDDTYELVGLLGKGGFGAVYRARQLNMDRDVALKLLIAGGPNFKQMVKRFRREVMAIRNLQHPNTVRIYDFRDRSDGVVYYTMEALEGRDLKQELAAHGPFSPRRAMRVIHQVLKSLAEAHSQGVIHRDLKPANIMLVEMHGETDFVKVLDFGIAKMLDDPDASSGAVEQITSTGIMVGTPRYMAPEQIAGEDLGPHTDLYGVGLMAIEMLTGSKVFEGMDRRTIIRTLLSDEPTMVPAPVASSSLGPVIARCVAKDRDERPEDADEILRLIQGVDIASLDDAPLYVSDGKGGWVPRSRHASATRPLHELDEFEEMETVVVSMGSSAEKTEVTPRPQMPEAADEQEQALRSMQKETLRASQKETLRASQKETRDLGPVSTEKPTNKLGKVASNEQTDGDKDLSDRTTRKVPQENLTPPEPTNAPNPPFSAPSAPPVPGSGDVSETDEAVAQSLVTTPRSSGGNAGANKLVWAVMIGAVAVGVMAAAVWLTGDDPAEDEVAGDMVSGQQADEPAQPQQQDRRQDQDEAEDIEVVAAHGDDEQQQQDEQPVHSLEVGVENEEIEAVVYLGDDKLGVVPQTVEWDEGTAEIRLEAQDYEPKTGRLEANGEERKLFELEPVAAQEDDEPREEPVAAERPAEEGRDAQPAPAQQQQPDEPEQADQSQPDEPEAGDDDTGWVDVPTSESEEEEPEEPDEAQQEEPPAQEDEDDDEDDEDESDVPLF